MQNLMMREKRLLTIRWQQIFVQISNCATVADSVIVKKTG